MKTRYFLLCALSILLLSSFKMSEACQYANSNLGYIKTQTQKAIITENLNESHFLAYRALNAWEKSKEYLDNCGCIEGSDLMMEAVEQLKMATKSTSLSDSRTKLNKSLENIIAAIVAIENHDGHGGAYGTDVLAMNTLDADKLEQPKELSEIDKIKSSIDISLISYEASLDVVVESVDCKDAMAFAKRIYNDCEEQLLREDLSEAKRYYNLRTKDITQKAIEKLGNFSK